MGETLRFYLDQHVPAPVAHGLRRRGVDVLTAQEAGTCGAPDMEQLRRAGHDKRVLVTFDSDLLALADQLDHAGIAFCPASKYSIGELLRVPLLLHDVLDPKDMENHVEFL